MYGNRHIWLLFLTGMVTGMSSLTFKNKFVRGRGNII